MSKLYTAELKPVSKRKYGKASRTLLKDFSKYAYTKDISKLQKELKSKKYGSRWQLDPMLSHTETKVFKNPYSRQAVIAFRGTSLGDKRRAIKDVASDLAIATGFESRDKRFRQSLRQFDRYSKSLKNEGYETIDLTGHSLGGSIASYVNKNRQGKVGRTVTFNKGSGIIEPLRSRPKNQVDISKTGDLISLGTRLQMRGKGKNVIKLSKPGTNPLSAHALDTL